MGIYVQMMIKQRIGGTHMGGGILIGEMLVKQHMLIVYTTHKDSEIDWGDGL